jgi:DNA-binding GntR family transcriptional regulator
MSSLSPAQAGAIATQGRALRRGRIITAHQSALLDTMLWAVRKPGSATFIASLNALARLAGQGRTTIAEGLKRLEELGLIQRIRRRARVAWMGAAVASRQLANAYRLVTPNTESGARPVREQSPDLILVVEAPHADATAAQEALRRVAEAMRERLRTNR